MKRYNHDQMLGLYEQWQVSGKSKPAFAEAHGIRPSTFYYWIRKFERSKPEDDCIMEDFGKRLKELRTAKNFSQEAFAQMIGVHVTHLSRYERGKFVPSLEVAEKMARKLDISLDEMVYRQQNEKARTHIVDNELLNLFNKTQQLPEDQKKTVMDLMSAFLLKANLRQELT